LDADHNDAVLDKIGANVRIICELKGGANLETASMDDDQHGQQRFKQGDELALGKIQYKI
jgi:hypothetical protein